MLHHYHRNVVYQKKGHFDRGRLSAQSQACSLKSLCSIIVSSEEEKSLCRVAVRLHPGGYKKATPASASRNRADAERCSTWNLGGLLMRCDEVKMPAVRLKKTYTFCENLLTECSTRSGEIWGTLWVFFFSYTVYASTEGHTWWRRQLQGSTVTQEEECHTKQNPTTQA